MPIIRTGFTFRYIYSWITSLSRITHFFAIMQPRTPQPLIHETRQNFEFIVAVFSSELIHHSLLQCPRRDLNPHPFQDWFLKPARLPIPPLGLTALGRTRTFTPLGQPGLNRSRLPIPPRGLMEGTGLEPATPGLQSRCSPKLSYPPLIQAYLPGTSVSLC